jgi:hypothetical protein
MYVYCKDLRRKCTISEDEMKYILTVNAHSHNNENKLVNVGERHGECVTFVHTYALLGKIGPCVSTTRLYYDKI